MATDVDQTSETTRVAREYFEAVGRAERDARQPDQQRDSGRDHGRARR